MENQKQVPNVWVYAPGEGAYKWDEFREQGVIALNWDKLEDLSRYSSKEAIAIELQNKEGGKGSKKNDALACYEFAAVMKPGDIIVAKKGRDTYLGYGVVISDYSYEPGKSEFKHLRKVEWKSQTPIKTDHKIVMKTLTNVSKYPDYVEKLAKSIGFEGVEIKSGLNADSVKREVDLYSLNTILYGPPGTGKTYNSVNKALDMLGVNTKDLERTRIKELFDQNVDDGNIVFTTFHQSMSYEEFIEGIKPVVSEDDKITYKIEDGILKKLSIKALKAILRNRESKRSSVTDFDSIYDRYLEEIKKYEGKDIYPFKSLTGSELKLEEIKAKSIIVKYRWGNNSTKKEAGTEPFTISKERLKLFLENNVSIDDGIKLKDKMKNLVSYNQSVFYAVYKHFYQFVVSKLGTEAVDDVEIVEKFEDLLDEWQSLSKEEQSILIESCDENFVLIIDEINRGNIAQIFGELITLIETEKRLGCEEGILLRLPYSKKEFSVPPNLFLLGTMNTADRSVEALDTALRRRFSFIEMMPDYKDLDEWSNKVLSTINKRIEILLSRDHLIGHSYFINAKSDEARKLVFKNKIIPLLQEYFYGDYGKIGLVLGTGFVELVKGRTRSNFFADFHYEDQQDILDRPTYVLKNFETLNFEESIRLLLNEPNVQTPANSNI